LRVISIQMSLELFFLQNHPQSRKNYYIILVKAIADYNMIQRGDRVMVCLSGGKDSFYLVRILHLLQKTYS